VRDWRAEGETETERAMAEEKFETFASGEALETIAGFRWKPQGRPEQAATLSAEWRPEVEAQFAIELGEPPRAAAVSLRP
jgi:hypothetical protein